MYHVQIIMIGFEFYVLQNFIFCELNLPWFAASYTVIYGTSLKRNEIVSLLINVDVFWLHFFNKIINFCLTLFD